MPTRIEIKTDSGDASHEMLCDELSTKMTIDEGGPNQLILQPLAVKAYIDLLNGHTSLISAMEANIIDLQNRVTALESS